MSTHPFLDAISEIYGCDRCNLCNFRKNICIYRGTPDAKVMIVGEAPGEREDEMGKPMVGKTGSYLVELFNRFGLPLRELYITNVVLCRPPNNDTPTKEQMDSCSEWLWMQIDLVRPEYIFAAGKIAMSRLDPKFITRGGKITKEAWNTQTPPGLKGAILIPILHPSAILRQEKMLSTGGVQVKTEYEARLKEVIEMVKEGRAF